MFTPGVNLTLAPVYFFIELSSSFNSGYHSCGIKIKLEYNQRHKAITGRTISRGSSTSSATTLIIQVAMVTPRYRLANTVKGNMIHLRLSPANCMMHSRLICVWKTNKCAARRCPFFWLTRWFNIPSSIISQGKIIVNTTSKDDSVVNIFRNLFDSIIL